MDNIIDQPGHMCRAFSIRTIKQIIIYHSWHKQMKNDLNGVIFSLNGKK